MTKRVNPLKNEKDNNNNIFSCSILCQFKDLKNKSLSFEINKTSKLDDIIDKLEASPHGVSVEHLFAHVYSNVNDKDSFYNSMNNFLVLQKAGKTKGMTFSLETDKKSIIVDLNNKINRVLNVINVDREYHEDIKNAKKEEEQDNEKHLTFKNFAKSYFVLMMAFGLSSYYYQTLHISPSEADNKMFGAGVFFVLLYLIASPGLILLSSLTNKIKNNSFYISKNLISKSLKYYDFALSTLLATLIIDTVTKYLGLNNISLYILIIPVFFLSKLIKVKTKPVF